MKSSGLKNRTEDLHFPS